MAVVAAWPEGIPVQADGFRMGAAPYTRRTQFDDGNVREEQSYAEPMVIRDVALGPLTDGEAIELRAFVEKVGVDMFLWVDPFDDQPREVRIPGGLAGLDLVHHAGPGGSSHWEGTVRLEGHWSKDAVFRRPVLVAGIEGGAATLGARGALSIWTAGLGDGSHVYWRKTSSTSRFYNLIDEDGQHLGAQFIRQDPSAIPAKFFRGTSAPRYFVRGELWINGVFSIGFSPTPRGSDWEENDDFNDHGMNLALLLRWRESKLAVRIRDIEAVDPDEPYYGRLADPEEMIAFIRGWVNDGRQENIEAALVWAGPGSVVDLATQTTRFGGADPTA